LTAFKDDKLLTGKRFAAGTEGNKRRIRRAFRKTRKEAFQSFESFACGIFLHQSRLCMNFVMLSGSPPGFISNITRNWLNLRIL
jgi:hypothetical protein